MSEAPRRWQALSLVIDLERLGLNGQNDTEGLEPLETCLFEHGALAVTLVDPADHPIHEPDPGQMPLWPTVEVEALFEGDQVISSVIDALHRQGWIDSPQAIQHRSFDDQEWTRAWMDRFEAMAFGDRLWVCPSHQAPDPSWPVVVRLDPGLAFGSGTHPTTTLCLQWLDRHSGSPMGLERSSVLDFGCGSGILAIAAARLGAPTLYAVDHDPQALIATQANAQANDCEDRVQTLTPESWAEAAQAVDLVLANILAQPLITLAPQLMTWVKPGGQLVLSGLLVDQVDSVCQAYRALDDSPVVTILDDWACLVFAHEAGSHYN